MIAFVDILGFKEMIKNRIDIPSVVQLLQNIKNKTSSFDLQFTQQDNKTYANYIPDFISFSDHMIISFPFSDNTGRHYQEYNVFSTYLYKIIVDLQIDALTRGYLLRGAITIGDVYYEANIIFGDKLIEAIEDEAHLAIYPRIIASQSLINFVKSYNLHFPYFKLDCDGILYIDYIAAIKDAPNDEQLKNIKNMIEKNIQSQVVKNNLNIKAKWGWLAVRFNNLYEKRVGKILY